jgi:hypothetical protein
MGGLNNVYETMRTSKLPILTMVISSQYNSLCEVSCIRCCLAWIDENHAIMLLS